MSKSKRHAKRMVAVVQPEAPKKERAVSKPPPNEDFHRSLIEMNRSSVASPHLSREQKKTRRSKSREAIRSSMAMG